MNADDATASASGADGHRDYRAGDVVCTTYGVGVIVQKTTICKQESVKDDKSNDTAATAATAAHRVDFFAVRLWRIPGKSMASSALAFLQPSTILCRLPAAPGMTTNCIIITADDDDASSSSTNAGAVAKDENGNEHAGTTRVLVHSYSHAKKTFLVQKVLSSSSSNMEDDKNPKARAAVDDNELLEVDLPNVQPAPSAKFYPVLETLMVRAEEARAVATQLLQGESAKRLVDQTTRVLCTTQEVAVVAAKTSLPNSSSSSIRSNVDETNDAEMKNIGNNDSEKASPETTTAVITTAMQNVDINPQETILQLVDSVEKTVLPQVDQNMKQVLSMVKDQELTQLLENCRQRLEQLVENEIPQATEKALEKAGIRLKHDEEDDDDIDDHDTNHQNGKHHHPHHVALKTISGSMAVSRKAALNAVQEVLKQANVDAESTAADLEQVRSALVVKFSTAFDSLATAARSDRSLSDIFESVAEKTTLWQQATGRLLKTRSASLFLEGASRLQARAASIFQQHHPALRFQQALSGEIESKFTKAFTEGDAALTRLKSIELGDAVKNRLVEAIQIRSDSLGGLDGIIAGALSTVRAKTKEHASSIGGGVTIPRGDQIQTLLGNLQSSASSVTTDAHETLISVLSHGSVYRDVSLLRIEGVLCDLESQFGSDLSPEDIAAVARGEGGTANLFEPIAKRALQVINKQLDAAEAHVVANGGNKNGNEAVLHVLSRVRKITSGQLTISALMDEFVSVLNDDNVVAAGESFVQRSEQVLDAIEGVSTSTNSVVSDAFKMVEKAGITKDSVMREIEKLDVDELLDAAGGAVTDEKKRRKLLSDATDLGLDFFLKILPSMPVPPLDSVKDGLVYHISNLSMEGFKVRKEDIQLEMAGMKATHKRRRKNASERAPKEDGVSKSDDGNETGHNISMESAESMDTLEYEDLQTTVVATELLIIDVKGISAILEDAVWSFEQTYMPYLKGNGKANVKLADGAIRLQFELRRRHKAKPKGDDPASTKKGEGADLCDMTDEEWEPVLCLHDRSCSIGSIELSLQGEGRLTWIFNKLASIFKGPLRDYVVKTIVRVLTNRSGWILERLNAILSPYWDLILRSSRLSMAELVEADDNVVMTAESTNDQDLIELVWRERLPLGINLLMNDNDAKIKVVDFPRGSQARVVCEKRHLDPDLFKGAMIVAVNGTAFDDQEGLVDALTDPGRPMTIQFRVAQSEEAERVRKFVEGGSNGEEPATRDTTGGLSNDGDEGSRPRAFSRREVVFSEPGELGIEFESSPDCFGLIVSSFIEGDGGIVLAAERTSKIRQGDLLTHVNDKLVVGLDNDGRSRSLKALEESSDRRPLVLTFVKCYLFREVIAKPTGVDINGGPHELSLTETTLENGQRRVCITGFNPVSGMAESGGILIGDHLVFVNAVPFGAGCRWLGESPLPSIEDLYEALADKSNFPIGLTFARPTQQASRSWFGSTDSFRDDEAETVCIAAERQDRIGCLFHMCKNGDIVVSDFQSVAGLFQRALARYKDHATTNNGKNTTMCLAVDSINGQFVPSYATKEMVKSAIARSWKSEQRVEIWLCDDERKQWVHSLCTIPNP